MVEVLGGNFHVAVQNEGNLSRYSPKSVTYCVPLSLIPRITNDLRLLVSGFFSCNQGLVRASIIDDNYFQFLAGIGKQIFDRSDTLCDVLAFVVRWKNYGDSPSYVASGGGSCLGVLPLSP